MGLKIDNVIKDMLSAAESIIAEEWPKVKDVMEKVLADEKDALQRLTDLRLSGAIDEEEFKDQLESERETFEAGVAMVRVQSKLSIQRAVNAAIGAFEKAVRALL